LSKQRGQTSKLNVTNRYSNCNALKKSDPVIPTGNELSTCISFKVSLNNTDGDRDGDIKTGK
jgi:hypothetical protein